MSSRLANKFPIPEKFPEILHDYAREVVRYRPKDIYDFSIQYFYSIEKSIPLRYVEGGSNQIQTVEETELKEKHQMRRKELSTPSLSTEPATGNMFFKQNQITSTSFKKEVNKTLSKDVTPIESERYEGSGYEGSSGRNKQNDRPLSTFSGASGTSSQKNGVRGFVNDVIKDSEANVKNQLGEK